MNSHTNVFCCRHIRATYNRSRNSLNFVNGVVWLHTERTPKETDDSKKSYGHNDDRPYHQSVCIPLDIFAPLFSDMERTRELLSESVDQVINMWNTKNLGPGMRQRRSIVQDHWPLHHNKFTRHGRTEKVYILLTVTSYAYTNQHQDDDDPPPIERKDLTVTVKLLDSLTESKKEDKTATYDELPIPGYGYTAQLEHFESMLQSKSFQTFCADASVIQQSIAASKKQVQDQRKRAARTGKLADQQQAEKRKKLEVVEDDEESVEEEEDGVQASQQIE